MCSNQKKSTQAANMTQRIPRYRSWPNITQKCHKKQPRWIQINDRKTESKKIGRRTEAQDMDRKTEPQKMGRTTKSTQVGSYHKSTKEWSYNKHTKMDRRIEAQKMGRKTEARKMNRRAEATSKNMQKSKEKHTICQKFGVYGKAWPSSKYAPP